MSNATLCADCFKSVRHEGIPTGSIESIGGVECYVAIPDGEYASSKVVLFLHDGLGMPLVNNRLLVDAFAANGFKTIMPDLFAGDSVTSIEDVISGKFDIRAWLGKHTQEFTRPILNSVVDALKQQGILDFGTTGYCFGGRYVFDLAFENITKASVAAHPSLLNIPHDLERYAKESRVPLLLNTCEVDEQFDLNAQEIADGLLGNGKFAPGYRRNYFPGCRHGFAVKGDLSDPAVKYGKEEAFKASVEWFRAYL